MKVLLLGVGLQGKVALHDLVNSDAVTKVRHSQELSKSSDRSELFLNNVTSGLGIPLLLLGIVSVVIIKKQRI